MKSHEKRRLELKIFKFKNSSDYETSEFYQR